MDQRDVAQRPIGEDPDAAWLDFDANSSASNELTDGLVRFNPKIVSPESSEPENETSPESRNPR